MCSRGLRHPDLAGAQVTPAEEAKYDYGYICGTQDASYGRDLSPAVPGESPAFRQGYNAGFARQRSLDERRERGCP